MNTQYDPEADALFVRFSDRRISESEEVAPGIILDFDEQHRIVALDVLNAREKMAAGAIPAAAA
jgi:uncharacterized protein YuzE